MVRLVALRCAAAFVLTAQLVACSALAPLGKEGGPMAMMRSAWGASPRGAGKISHVVIIVQENRSFDDLFYGYPGADTATSGLISDGKRVALHPVSLAQRYVVDHSLRAMIAACNGRGALPGTKCRMNGFDREAADYGPGYPQYVYVPHSESKPYFDMAHEWVLADRMFQSQLDESFVAHQYLIAGQAHASVDVPAGLWGCDGGGTDFVSTITGARTYGPVQAPCFDYETLGDELDRAGLSWRFYTSNPATPSNGQTSAWSGYQAVRHIRYGPDWAKDVVTPQNRFITDVGRGKLANVTWITPICANSDHAYCGGGYGPSWVSALVNAVGKSKFWNGTAIFVLWDDWGGMYDHVPPPMLDTDGNGFRIPLLAISPYAKSNYVSHVQYETASVLTFTEDAFGLKRLAASDARATSPAADCFDFTQAPRPFVPIHAPLDRRFFLTQRDDGRAPDYE